MKSKLRRLLYQGALRIQPRRPPAARSRRYRLAILKLDRLGDAVLALGAVRRLVREFGEADTLLIVSPIAEPLFAAEFPGVERLVLPAFCASFWPDYLSFLSSWSAALQSLDIDTLVCLRHQRSDYLHAVAQLLAPRRCFASRWTPVWEARSLDYPAARLSDYPETVDTGCLELEAHRRVVAAALGRELSLQEVQPRLTATATAVPGRLLVCPVAGEAIREYPPALLAETLRLLAARQPVNLHFCLPPQADAAPWQNALQQAGVVCEQWHQPATWADFRRCLDEAEAVLAPDSAPAHLATALDKPGVFLLGGGHPGMFAPWQRSDRQLWLRQPLPCYHCRWSCPFEQARCLTGIAPATVTQALAERLTPAQTNTARPTPDTWIVIPVHNRCATTRRCLQHLQALGVPDWATVLVVDDGSSDGTAAMLPAEFPWARVATGDGSLWWAGAIRLGMETAVRAGAGCICWLNDDSLPEAGALETLVALAVARHAICGGVCRDANGGPFIYAGGRMEGTWPKGWTDPPTAQQPPRAVDWLHGNLVAVPAAVWRRIGLPECRWMKHNFADVEYTFRARRHGLPVLLVAEARGVADTNDSASYRSWADVRLDAGAILRGFWNPKVWWYAPGLAYFKIRSFGPVGVASFLALLLKALCVVPAKFASASWLAAQHRRWRGKRGAAPRP